MKDKKTKRETQTTPSAVRKNGFGNFKDFINFYSTTGIQSGLVLVAFLLGLLIGAGVLFSAFYGKEVVSFHKATEQYWFVLKRASNNEYLYYGIPGDTENSRIMKRFIVKSGIPGERPTPLPQKVGRNYWKIIKKYPTDNPETAPYFLELDVPGIEAEPYGPVPYTECGGEQCNWILPGAFGLHGVNGDNVRLSKENPGSSGCIRHSDVDITMLYQLLDPTREEIRYYVEDI